MTSFERTAKAILERLKPLGLIANDEDKCISAIITVLLEEKPGRNDILQEAFLVANWHKLLYPTDVFPANGLTPDAWAAKGCRLVAENIGNRILDLQDFRD